MNIEIANRLVSLRKENSLSQEALAEKLGISRQAVSKWERAEASPDTDNLIMLARLYGISLDELLRTEEDVPAPPESRDAADAGKIQQEPQTENTYTENNYYEQKQEDAEYFHIGTEGIQLKDKDGSQFHIDEDGIHIDEGENGDNLHINKDGVFVNGRKYDNNWLNRSRHFPFALIIVALYFVMGTFFHAWHPAWMLFLLITVWYSFVEAVKKRNAYVFAYPVLAVLVYLCGGFFMETWHPGWLIFLTVPIYYALVSYIQNQQREDEY